MDGDINIAVLVPASRDASNLLCNPKTSIVRKIFIEYVYFVRKNIDEINKNKDFLKNVRLGYVFMDTCTLQSSALKHALKLIPRNENSNENCNESNSGMAYYDVQAVISGAGSSETLPLANILSRFSIPILSPFASSDDLSDKARYEYFSRLISPDKYQADALTDFLLEFQWNYISLIFLEGSYGENGAKQIRKQAKKKSICIAIDEMISTEDYKADVIRIVKKLKENKKARVIVAFLFITVADEFYLMMDKFDIAKEKIVVGSDAMIYARTPRTVQLRAINSFGVTTAGKDVKGGFQYFSDLNPANNSSFLLIKDYWASLFDCSWSNNATNPCDPHKNFTLANVSIEATASFNDCLMVFVQAIDRIIKRNCPNATGVQVRKCIRGRIFLDEIRKGTFETSQGQIQFDEKGDVIGGYNLVQFFENNFVQVIGSWSRKRSGIDFVSNVSWSDSDQPKSLCSEPCPPKHYFIQKAVVCCWDCRKCRNNEILVLNKTACKECPEFYWPDEKEALECLPIDPESLKWADPETIILLSLAVFGICKQLTL
ncbi:DgyrCDS821 [Dimorphilus gyrociliatus]|uniref:DgyrCDS821 n=1 Tax=Dimorphilus gyrociliatus TaxID=2664684 RepID=A0A7I8V8J0_9ANNE|nr:DgyrCDS821 [Dimorphilus gyrociliatus]